MTPSELITLDATALAAKVHAREITARELVEATLQRIDDVDPTVNAFRLVMVDEARSDADRIDALGPEERALLPLAGIPVAIKDDTDVAGQSTMWGTTIDRGICSHDAEVVERLRRAGAVIIGKTNVPELTLWPWTESDAWGVTRNPWNPERTPGGSSGGSAAAVCTGMAALALGSDGGGSVRYPAALTGLVGLKPQRGRLPLGAEHGAGWHGLIVLGTLTRSVRDAALFLAVASDAEHGGGDDELAPPGRSLRIAVAANPPPGSQVSLTATGRQIVDDAAQMMADLGHEVIETKVKYGRAALWNSTVRLLKGVCADVDSLPNQDRLEPRTRAVARLGRALPTRSLTRAMDRQASIARSINQGFDGADVVLTPVCESPAPLLRQCPTRGALRSLRAANTSAWLVPWNLTGQPALTIPTGVDADALPTAVQLVGRAGDEATLLTLAAQIEASHPFPRCPRPVEKR